MKKARQTDHLIIGSGIAGLMLALKLAKSPSARVLIIAKGALEENNTWYAQGGIASVLDPGDTFAEHITDTLKAGAGLCHEPVVRLVVESGPRLIRELIDLGVQFTLDPTTRDTYHLTIEGGHSHRRVIHAHDLTGREVLRALIARVKSEKRIEVLEDHHAVDLISSDRVRPSFSQNACLGAYVMDAKTRSVLAVHAKYTYLCTGGHGKAYLYTSNPDSATGDGLAMAWRAGCRVANLEFMQFHPTCLYHLQGKTFLISEAVRGEGGILRTLDGEAFMDKYHPMGNLAPRDVVARAIDSELKRRGDAHVYLDVRHLGREVIERHFPNIYQTCLSLGIDIAKMQIPVVPAAHYSCGGVVVDDWGRTNVERLFAIGEVACTGLHGANRLASNSLLEALVFADRAAQYIEHSPERFVAVSADFLTEQKDIMPWKDRSLADAPIDETVVLSHLWDEIRRLMWHYVGIVRTEKRLKRALDRLSVIRSELDDQYWAYKVTPEVIEVRNLALVAWLTVRCAMSRKESRGIHYMLDFPEVAQDARDTLLSSNA